VTFNISVTFLLSSLRARDALERSLQTNYTI